MRKLNVIAKEILADWKNPYFGAVPYLRVLSQLETIKDQYGQENAQSIIVYFLANAQTWRGEVARRIKKELNQMVKNGH